MARGPAHRRPTPRRFRRGAIKNIGNELAGVGQKPLAPEQRPAPPRPFLRYDPPAIEAQSAVCLKASDRGEAPLFEKQPGRPTAPASLTKLMTAFVLQAQMRRFGLSLEDLLAIEEADLTSGSGQNVKPGDLIALRDAFTNLMLPSSNVTANAVARTVGGLLCDAEGEPADAATARFVTEMNAAAASLGMSDTRFRNPSGLPARGQVTTARDMARLVLAVSELPAVAGCWGKPSHVMRVTGAQPRDQRIASTNKILGDYDVLGGKTGTLVPGCYHLAFVSRAPDDDMLVTVVLRAPDPRALYANARGIVDAVKRGHDWGTGSESIG